MPRTQPRRTASEAELDEIDTRPAHRRSYDSDENGPDDDEDMNGGDEKAENDRLLAKKLVRYAISCEYARVAIRRDGIRERVLGNHGRSFKRIFDLAQKQLRTAWGMELQELPVREKVTLQEKRQAMKSNTALKTGSGAYILTSTLPDAYRKASIIQPSKAPSAYEEASYAGFYTMIISMIYLNGRELTDSKLRKTLQRLNADQNFGAEKTDTTLKRMEKHGYIFRKIDRPPVGQDGEMIITWLVGTRAREEIGLDGVMGMVREVYGDSNPQLEKQLAASLGLKERVAENEGEGEARAGRVNGE